MGGQKDGSKTENLIQAIMESTKMRLDLIKWAIAAMMAVGFALLTAIGPEAATAARVETPDDAAVYKAKCAMCHSPKAEKFYDPAKSEDEHVQIVLKGKKGEKPPYMPGYEEKGMTADEARSLVKYMDSLRKPN